MMRVNEMITLPMQFGQELLKALTERLRELARAVNAQETASGIAAPTTGQATAGTFVRNVAPTEAGSGGSKYVILGWVCVTGGAPGTWKEVRTLTGA